MIPLKDNIRSSTRPYVNWCVIGLCSVVFALQLGDPSEGSRLVEQYAMIPKRVLDPDATIHISEIKRDLFGQLVEVPKLAESPPFPPFITLLTCIFLHGGWLHILGNMWFLWIFGDNVEDRLGHFGFAVFYLAAGVLASGVHLASSPGSEVPTLGASGAIAGVMGAYLLLYPHARVMTLIPIFFFIEILVLPASFFLGIWFLLQLFQGTMRSANVEAGGVAWWAHIGGFVAGVAWVWVLRRTGHLSKHEPRLVPGSDGSRRYRRYRPF